LGRVAFGEGILSAFSWSAPTSYHLDRTVHPPPDPFQSLITPLSPSVFKTQDISSCKTQQQGSYQSKILSKSKCSPPNNYRSNTLHSTPLLLPSFNVRRRLTEEMITYWKFNKKRETSWVSLQSWKANTWVFATLTPPDYSNTPISTPLLHSRPPKPQLTLFPSLLLLIQPPFQ
jgi:hypothetical protein